MEWWCPAFFFAGWYFFAGSRDEDTALLLSHVWEIWAERGWNAIDWSLLQENPCQALSFTETFLDTLATYSRWAPLYRSLAYLFRMERNPRKKVKEENIARIKFPLFHKCSMRWFHVTWGGTNNAHPHIHIFIDINKDILFSAKRKWIFVEQKEKIIIWKWKMVQNKKRKNVNWSMEFICANMIAR